jgi:mannose-6-phosphate isomerase-like protein (cupin superfamily)
MSVKAMPAHIGAGEGRLTRVFASELEISAAAATGLSFGMFRSRFPEGAGMPFLHLHRSYEEAFHVLEGTVQFRLGTDEFLASAGSTILVPPGTPHCFRNAGPSPVDWLVVTAPALAVDFIEEASTIRRGEFDLLAELFERYDSELLERRPHWA